MFKIVAGLGENTNIKEAALAIKDFEVELVNCDDALIKAINNPNVDGVIRGSLSASNLTLQRRH